MTFSHFFAERLGRPPYEYQERLAAMPIGNRAIHVPTGAGKTAAVVLAWLWRRRTGDAPRRLVYLLPMRTLVDQTYAAAKDWARDDAKVYKMLGGEVEEEWEKHPEEPAIVIGTI